MSADFQAGRVAANCEVETLAATLRQFEALGNEKVRAQSIRHGAGDNQYGVRLGDIRTVAKGIKTDHALALALWATGNVDARLLATLVIRPQSLSVDELDAMVRAVGCAQVGRLAHCLCHPAAPRQGNAAPALDDRYRPVGSARGLGFDR